MPNTTLIFYLQSLTELCPTFMQQPSCQTQKQTKIQAPHLQLGKWITRQSQLIRVKDQHGIKDKLFSIYNISVWQANINLSQTTIYVNLMFKCTGLSLWIIFRQPNTIQLDMKYALQCMFTYVCMYVYMYIQNVCMLNMSVNILWIKGPNCLHSSYSPEHLPTIWCYNLASPYP